MRLRISVLAFALTAFLVGGPVWAHDHPAKVEDQKRGRVLFKTSCSPEAHKQFGRALVMLHSFIFPETIKAFTAVAETDPSCAIAYWGVAVSLRPNPLLRQFDAATLERGLEAVKKGKAIGAPTQRERDWLAAIAEFYKDYDSVNQETRTKNYEKAMRALAKRYPDDVEAKIFHALALNETFDYKNTNILLNAVQILERLAGTEPDHPGITHYLVHSYDHASLAKRGVPAASRYSKIAPAAPHALHLPSHIYSLVGMWEASIASNYRSVASGNKYAAKNSLDGVFPDIPHSYDFLQYAYLQLGQDVKARALLEEAGAIRKFFAPRLETETGQAAVAARYMLERQDWRGAASLSVHDLVKLPAARAITHFARAMGAARSGEFLAAHSDIDILQELRATLERANQQHAARQVDVQLLAARAWVAQGQGNRADGLKFMRAAAELEDASGNHPAMEIRLYPMRELLADMLLLQGDATKALKEYEVSLQNAPMRLRGFYGAAKAAETAGDRKKAVAYFKDLARLTTSADGDREELREMRQALAHR
jgi:tetratricopeptide (TPR) repeat protein